MEKKKEGIHILSEITFYRSVALFFFFDACVFVRQHFVPRSLSVLL